MRTEVATIAAYSSNKAPTMKTANRRDFATVHQENLKLKQSAVLIEPDMSEMQPPRKKLKPCAQNDLVEALLALRSCSIPPVEPLLQPSPQVPIETPRGVRPVHVVWDDSNPISDDEDDLTSTRFVDRVTSANRGKDTKPIGRPRSTFNLPLSGLLPVGRPLPPAPRFPQCAPGQTLKRPTVK